MVCVDFLSKCLQSTPFFVLVLFLLLLVSSWPAVWKLWYSDRLMPCFGPFSGEPNNQGNSDCVGISKANGQWSDFKCTDRYGYICEKMGEGSFLFFGVYRFIFM